MWNCFSYVIISNDWTICLNDSYNMSFFNQTFLALTRTTLQSYSQKRKCPIKTEWIDKFDTLWAKVESGQVFGGSGSTQDCTWSVQKSSGWVRERSQHGVPSSFVSLYTVFGLFTNFSMGHNHFGNMCFF